MDRINESEPQQEPVPEPGVPLKPDPGYPETRGGTRDMDTEDK
jgi:hypothetical protein